MLLDDAVAAARREAASAFGDPTLLFERYVEHGRHIEVQVLADEHGNVVHLFERECSVQRRHQKVIEESPSPFVTPEMRAEMAAEPDLSGYDVAIPNPRWRPWLFIGVLSLLGAAGAVAVGVAAVFVLLAMIDGHPNWRRRVHWLNLAGLLDFGGAITTGVLTSNSSLGFFAPATPMASMGLLPLSLIPTFAVPLWTIIHFASLLQLRQARE